MNAAQSPELQLRIQAWREKARNGTLTQEEMKEAILALRQDRISLALPTAGSRVTKERKAAAAKPNAAALLDELDKL